METTLKNILCCQSALRKWKDKMEEMDEEELIYLRKHFNYHYISELMKTRREEKMKVYNKTECLQCKKKMVVSGNPLCYGCYNDLLDDLKILGRQSSVISDKKFQEWNEKHKNTAHPMFINGLFNAHPERIKTDVEFLTPEIIDHVVTALASKTIIRRKVRDISVKGLDK